MNDEMGPRIEPCGTPLDIHKEKKRILSHFMQEANNITVTHNITLNAINT